MRKIILLIAVLFGFTTQVLAADNYAATAGSGLTFGAKDAAGVLYSRFIGCDNTTVSQCWAVDASGRLTALAVQSGTWTVQPGNTANTTPWLFSVNQGGNTAKVQAGNAAAAADVALTVTDPNVLAAVNSGVGTPGSAVPSTGIYFGGNVAGNFRGWTGVNPTGSVYAQQVDVASYGGTSVGVSNPQFVAPLPTTSGGLSNYNVQPTASDNHAVIKAGAGQVYKIEAFNNSATINYIRLYNATTGFNGCNSATNLVWQGLIPASTSGAGLSSSWDLAIAFATGISICVTSGYAQTDTTNATASALIVNIGYK